MTRKQTAVTAAMAAMVMVAAVVGHAVRRGGQEAAAVADSLRQDREVAAFIADMYNNERYLDYDFLRKHCSATLLKRLADEYGYEGEGLAVWSFRTGAQDSKDADGTSGVTRVRAVGGHWHEYTYLDMGWAGRQMLLVRKRGGTFVMEDKKELYNEYGSP